MAVRSNGFGRKRVLATGAPFMYFAAIQLFGIAGASFRDRFAAARVRQEFGKGER